MGSRLLSRIGLDQSLLNTLATHKIYSCKDFLSRSPFELFELCDLGGPNFQHVFDMVCAATVPRSIKASKLLQESNRRNVSTGLLELDTVLCGGLVKGTVTEITGPPGSGKTQFCMQAAVACASPIDLGGKGLAVLYIDTENSFSADRLLEISHWRNMDCVDGQDLTANLLDLIHVCRDGSCDQVKSRLDSAEELMIEANVGLLIVDSMAAMTRGDFDCRSSGGMSERNDWLIQEVTRLKYLAEALNIPVLVTNHITTRAANEVDGEEGHSAVAALGNTWHHSVNTRLVLDYAYGMTRRLRVAKSPVAPLCEIPCSIEAAGVVPTGPLQRCQVQESTATSAIVQRHDDQCLTFHGYEKYVDDDYC